MLTVWLDFVVIDRFHSRGSQLKKFCWKKKKKHQQNNNEGLTLETSAFKLFAVAN